LSAEYPKPVNWEEIIEDAEKPDLSGTPAEQGTQFHQWLEDRYEDSRWFRMEVEVEWLNDEDEWEKGRYDCFDGHYVYELKTVRELPDEPRGPDVDQLGDYLDAVDTGLPGFVVYVTRDEVGAKQYLVDR